MKCFVVPGWFLTFCAARAGRLRARRHAWTALQGLALVLLSWASLGCGMISAVTTPKAAWAIAESPPLSVVVRRAEAARATSLEVDRLLGGTPVDEPSKWIGRTGMTPAEATEL